MPVPDGHPRLAEERIDEMIGHKREWAQRVVGTREAWLTDLSTDDLRAAVALRPDDAAVTG